MKRSHRQTPRTGRHRRRGSAMLLCFLAIAVVSVASIAIARSHRRLNMRRSVVQTAVQGRLVADGLVNREIAYQRYALGGSVAPADKSLRELSGFQDAAIQLSAMDTANQTISLDVALYKNAPLIRRAMVSYASEETVNASLAEIKSHEIETLKAIRPQTNKLETNKRESQPAMNERRRAQPAVMVPMEQFQRAALPMNMQPQSTLRSR